MWLSGRLLPSLPEALNSISHTLRNKIKAFVQITQEWGRGSLHPTDEGKVEFPCLTETPTHTPSANNQDLTTP